MQLNQSLSEVESIRELRSAFNNVLVGKSNVVEHVLVCILARGHLLLEDKPGLGKTTLAKAIANAVQGCFARVQCTPDLMPSDVTGFNMFNQKTREFEFRHGPVFSDVLLADEINRATPRAQSALFEAMAERQVTIDNQRFELATTFFVIATQNPTDSHGAYPLPQAQLDRFAMKLSIGYPSLENESDMLAAAIGQVEFDRSNVQPIIDIATLQRMQEQVSCIDVTKPVRDYLLALGHRTREHPRVRLGVSPRGLLTWQSLAQAHAFLDERDFVTPHDIQSVAQPVLSVRLDVEADSVTELIDEILEQEAVPVK